MSVLTEYIYEHHSVLIESEKCVENKTLSSVKYLYNPKARIRESCTALK